MDSDTTEKRSKIYNNGEWDVKYLKFLTDFMRETGNTTSTLAAKLGIGRQAMYNYLVRDDMRLSVIENIMDACGCQIRYSLEKPESTSGNVVMHLKDYMFRNVPDGVTIGRLWFLSVAMQRYGITGKEIADRLGLSRSTVSTWFATNNVLISHIYKICEAFGLEMKIEITMKEG